MRVLVSQRDGVGARVVLADPCIRPWEWPRAGSRIVDQDGVVWTLAERDEAREERDAARVELNEALTRAHEADQRVTLARDIIAERSAFRGELAALTPIVARLKAELARREAGGVKGAATLRTILEGSASRSRALSKQGRP